MAAKAVNNWLFDVGESLLLLFVRARMHYIFIIELLRIKIGINISSFPYILFCRFDLNQLSSYFSVIIRWVFLLNKKLNCVTTASQLFHFLHTYSQLCETLIGYMMNEWKVLIRMNLTNAAVFCNEYQLKHLYEDEWGVCVAYNVGF